MMASINDVISTNMSIACPPSERKIEDDNSAADKGRNPLSWLQTQLKILNFQEFFQKADFKILIIKFLSQRKKKKKKAFFIIHFNTLFLIIHFNDVEVKNILVHLIEEISDR